jgi:hypothetical protein
MKLNSPKTKALLAAAGLMMLSGPAFAQDLEANTVTVGDTGDATTEREDDNDFPWGLLGLLGLAGLLGRKKRDDNDIRVDARRDTRP